MGLFDALFQSPTGTSPLSGGLLSRFTSSGGILSTDILNTRLATIQAATTPMAKVQALVGTLGMRLRSFQAPPATTTTSSGTQTQGVYTLPPPPFHAMPNYQSSAQRVLTAGSVATPAVQFS